jgi:hypothetical protein
MTEAWLPVAGFEGRYEVSDQGRVRSMPGLRFAGGVKKPSATKKGHLKFDLYSGGKKTRVHRYGHRLVLEAFVGPCPDGMEACHGDGNPANNALSNLRWDTPQSNWADARAHGTARVRDTHHWSKLTGAQVAEIQRRYAEGALQRQLAADYGVIQQTISYIVRRAA